MPYLAERLAQKIALVCPIDGVSIKDPTDKTTWRIDFRTAATADQRTAAHAVVAAFDINATEIPASISLLQARRALRAAGLLDAVKAKVAASSDDIKDAWEYASSYERADPIIALLASELGMSDVQIDQLFLAASQL